MTDLTARAFEIADEAMFELLECHSLAGDEYGVVRILTDEDGRKEVDTLAEASEALREAVEWLAKRGYVEVAQDRDGEHILVLRRPGEE